MRWHDRSPILALILLLGCSTAPPSSPVPASQSPSAPTDGSTDAPASPVSVGNVTVTPNAVLLTGSGQTAQLTADATAPDGSPTSVTWSSSAPQIVSVDAQGKVTALAELGSALIYAETADRSTPVAILIAEPVAGAVLVSDANVVTQPQPLGDPNTLPQNGDRYRVTLTGMDAPAAGAVLIATGSAEIGGRVVTSSTNAASGVDVEYELLPLPQMFARYDFDLDLPLDLLDAGLEPTANAGQIASLAGPQLPLPRAANAEAELEKEAKFEKGPLTCKLSAAAKFKSTNFDIKATTNLKLEIEGRKEIANASTPEHTKVVLTGPVALDVFGGLKAEAGFEGKAECELKKHIPIPIGGVLAVVLAVTVPIGLTVGAEGSVKAVDVELGPKGHLGTTVTVGFQCDTNACWAIKEHTPDQNNGINFESKVNLLRDMRVEANVAINVITGLGFKVGTEEYSLIDAKIGPIQSLNLAFDDAQARDTGYASAYDLKVAGSVTPGDDLKTAISRIFGGEVTLDLSAKYESKPLSESPKGRLSVEKPRVELGKTVGLYVDVDPKTMSYFLLGPNVVELRVFRWKDNRLTPVGTMPVSASGQTRFEYIWTPTRDFLGMNELVAYVTTKGLPAVPLEIAPNSSAFVEVVEACLGEVPTPGPVQPPGSGSPGPIAPTAPPEDPCAADLTITLERDYDELLIDERWTITGDLERLEDAVLLPGQLEGEYVGVGQYSGDSNNAFCPTDARPAELTHGEGRVWMTANVADDGGPFDAALAGRRIFVVQVMPVIDDLIANPDNPAPGALIGYVPIEGGTHTNVERWTDGFLTCGALGEKRLTVTLQPTAIAP